MKKVNVNNSKKTADFNRGYWLGFGRKDVDFSKESKSFEQGYSRGRRDRVIETCF